MTRVHLVSFEPANFVSLRVKLTDLIKTCQACSIMTTRKTSHPSQHIKLNDHFNEGVKQVA